MKNMKLVPESRTLHKSSTVILSAFLILLSILEIAQPYLDVIAPVIAPGVFPWISAGLGIAIGIGRYIRQDLKDGKLDGRIDDAE